MTNRKLKPGKVGKNLFLLGLAKTNTEMLSKFMIALVKSEGVSRPRLRELLDIYQSEYVPRFEKLSEDSMHNVIVKRHLSQIGVDFRELGVLTFPGYDESMCTVFRENAGIFCIMLNDQAGFGAKRLRRTIRAAAKITRDVTDEVYEILGYEIDPLSLPDVTDYAEKKERFTRGELRNIRRGLDAFREITGK